MPRLRITALLAALCAAMVLAQRPTPPTRDPHTPGYVKAKELPDGALPSPKEDGNFIVGPTYKPAPEVTVQEGVPQGQVFDLVMQSPIARSIPASRATPAPSARLTRAIPLSSWSPPATPSPTRAK